MIEGVLKDDISYHYEIKYNDVFPWGYIVYKPYIKINNHKEYIGVFSNIEQEIVDLIKYKYGATPIRDDGTNIKDINGVEIRVGDIVEVDTPYFAGSRSTGEVGIDSRNNVELCISSNTYRLDNKKNILIVKSYSGPK